MARVAVVIPTIPERSKFLKHALSLLDKQTVKPDIIEVVCKDQGITANYLEGFKAALKKGAELIICWEDDDYYTPQYIEITLQKWREAGRPDLFGWNQTYYLNLNVMKYVHLKHPGHASMMGTALNYRALKDKLKWPHGGHAYLDMFLWKHNNINKKDETPINRVMNIGIKHHLTKVGGGGHNSDWGPWKKSTSIDAANFLKNHVPTDSLEFYMDMVFQNYVTVEGNNIDPFLTIITRRYKGKRPKLTEQHNKSKLRLTNQEKIQFIYIDDPIGLGMHRANAAFEKVAPWVKGKYVHLLDDDDFYSYREVVEDLENKCKGNPQIVYFKMIILNGSYNNMYPSKNVWGRDPIIAQIGGSCFIVREDLWRKHIHHFNKARCGDFHFISNAHKEASKIVWFDKVVCETGKVSRGKPE